MILAERAARIAAETKAAEASAVRQGLTLEIERLKLEIARLRRERFGPSAERSARLKQLELSLEDLEEAAAEADAAQAPDAGETTEVRAFARRKPARRPLPEHLPRTRVVYPAPAACPCCGGRVRKLGEVVTESLERVPASWFVVQHVREKVSCRACEAITEAPAPFHPIARGRAGPNLLAEVVFAKYGLHLPLHRQSERFAREGVPIEVSTLADWVGPSRSRSSRWWRRSRPMCWQAPASMPMTRPCRCWPKARPEPGGCGRWCGMTDRLVGRTRPRQPTSTRRIGG